MSANDRKVSSKKGSLASVTLIIGVLVAFILGALGVDFMHMLAVKEELQNATDAGALADFSGGFIGKTLDT